MKHGRTQGGNRARIERIAQHTAGRIPKYMPGIEVDTDQGRGIIDSIYADYDAVLSTLMIRPGWYEQLARPPRTPKSGFWYGVVLSDGDILVGEDDMALAD
jgi:hypothetical protein